MSKDEYINDYMKVNEKPADRVFVGYQVLYSNDNLLWEVTDHQPNDYQIAKDWFESLTNHYPYVELVCEVCGIFGTDGEIDECETLSYSVLARYEKEEQ